MHVFRVSALRVHQLPELHVGKRIFLRRGHDWNWKVNLCVARLLDAFFAGDKMKFDLVADAEELFEVLVESRRRVGIDLFAGKDEELMNFKSQHN